MTWTLIVNFSKDGIVKEHFICLTVTNPLTNEYPPFYYVREYARLVVKQYTHVGYNCYVRAIYPSEKFKDYIIEKS